MTAWNKSLNDMKKLFIRIMALVLGLNVFTACYGPARIPDNYLDDTELTGETKASDVEEEKEEASEGNDVPQP